MDTKITLKANIIEGTASLQCACPDCEYGEGYLESFIPEFSEQQVVKCPTCELEFIALVI